MKKRAIFTIVSCNYFHFAKTLMKSIKESGTDADLFVLLVDHGYDAELFSSPVFTTVPVLDVPIPDFKKMAFIYTVIELNTAVKPFFIEYLWDKGYEHVIYLDPDIYCYRPFDEIFARLSDYDAVVTPHITAPLTDGFNPDDLAILRSGVYNLGFVALARSPETQAFLEWWQDKLFTLCKVDLPRGLFVDQIWCNFLPCFVEKTLIEHNPGWNVAYWNLIHRTVSETQSGYKVNGEPLLFFHFSGVTLGDDIVFSKHENRFRKKGLPKTVQKLVEEYVAKIRSDGADKYGEHRYYFNYFPGTGQHVSPPVRWLYIKDHSIQAIFGDDPFDVSRDPGFLRTYNYPAFSDDQPVTKLMRQIYEMRPDLKRAFPDIEGRESEAIARWFLSAAQREYGLGEMFTGCVLEMLTKKQNQSPEALAQKIKELPARVMAQASQQNVAQMPAADNSPNSAVSRMWRKLSSRAAIRLAEMSRYFLSPQKRDRLKMWALRLAYLKEENPSSSQQAGPKKFVPGGINVVGYLHGELGVGEAARSTIAAAQAAGLQVSAIDFRTGCLARMQHSLRGIRNQGPLYETSIFHVNADQVPVMASHFGRPFFQGHLNIGFWFWELPIFPDKWMDSFLPFQEIWVASTFCLDAIAQKSPVPVRRIPLCIEPEVPSDIDRRTFKLPEDEFLFLAMGDFLSVPERKNLMGAVEAFRRAFGKNASGARLILKILNPNARSDMMAKLASYSSDDSSIIIIDDYKSRVELNGLINCCDCLVSLHRSEGFGLPIAEAMYMAKPVIATGWSSNMDFMNFSNSFPVKYKLVQLEQDYGPYEKGNFWADPDLDHAADLMRRACADPDLGREIGNNAAQSVRQDLSPEAVGRLIKERINDTRNVH